LELACLQIFLRKHREVVLDRPLAGDVQIEGGVIRLFEDVHDVLRRAFVGEPDFDQDSVPSARSRLAEDILDPWRLAQPCDDLVHLGLEARLTDGHGIRGDEHDVGRELAGGRWESLAEQVVGLLRLRVVELFGLSCERVAEEEDDQADRGEDRGAPGGHGTPGMPGRSCRQTPGH
jgi:hypothetical protein